MLKDVGMAVPQNQRNKGSIYAARQLREYAWHATIIQIKIYFRK